MAIPSATLTISEAQFSQSIGLLGQFVAIPSISDTGNSEYKKGALDTAANFARSQLTDLGFKVDLISIEGSPSYVLAERITNASKPTLLLYAHYDVQPVDRKEWHTDPFKMVEKDGRLYGRGASDDKAGIISILTALRAIKEARGDLPCNIRILFEGEEEFDSSHMPALLKQQAARLQANAMLILDGLNKNDATGTLNSSSKGLVKINLRVDALKQPVHSGIGSLAPCPAMALSRLHASLYDYKEIPGFMDDFTPLTPQERAILKAHSSTDEEYAAEQGMLPGTSLRGDPKVSVFERIEEEVSISVVNMKAGQTNGGNSIQESASSSVGIRLPAGQDPDRIGKLVVNYLKAQEKELGLPVTVSQAGEGSWAWKADLTKPYAQLYLKSLSEGFPGACGMPVGGTLPLLKLFADTFKDLEIIVPGVEDDKTCAHSHNESQSKIGLRRTINSLISFILKVGNP